MGGLLSGRRFSGGEAGGMSEKEAEQLPDWENEDWPEWWNWPPSKEAMNDREQERSMAMAASVGLCDGDTSALVDYLLYSRELVIPPDLRQTLLGLMIGGAQWGRRIRIDKHPALARAPRSSKEQYETDVKKYQSVQIFLKNGLKKYDAGISDIVEKLRIPDGTARGYMRSSVVEPIRRAYAAGLDENAAYIAATAFGDLNLGIWAMLGVKLANECLRHPKGSAEREAAEAAYDRHDAQRPEPAPFVFRSEEPKT